MIKLASASLVAVALGLTLAAGPAFAQKGEEPPCTKNCEPPKEERADCSPGYYKNHVDTWDDGICCAGDAGNPDTACGQIYRQLCAECGATPIQRRAAKQLLDTCFGTAPESPCQDD
ncbi:MAG: hypothetical protein ACREVH_10655 [Gammaproteobacteria bacterium]